MVTGNVRKRLAREWLYLIGLLVFGFIVLPCVLTLAFTAGDGFWRELGKFYAACIEDSDDSWIVWVLVLAPYILVQLVRSIAWAWRNSRDR